MKNLIIFFLTFAILPAALAKKAQPTKQLTPAQLESITRMTTFTLLQQVQASLEAYYQRGDKKALDVLLSAWSKEEQLELKKDFLAHPEKPEFRVEGPSLFITSSEGQTELKVIDPMTGRFQINGHAIRIQPHSKYRYLQQQLDELKKVSRNLFFDLFISRAEALGPAAPLVACLRFCRPVVSAAGGFISRNAPRVAANLKADMAAAGNFAAKTWDKVGLPAIVGPSMGACMFTGHLGAKLPCDEIPARVMCTAGVKSKCIEKVSDLTPTIEQANATTANRITVVKPKHDNKCMKTETGFYKEATILVLSTQDMKKMKADAPLPSPIASSEVHLEYEKNPKDPEKLIKKSLTEVIKNAKGEVEGKRVWTFDGDSFKIEYSDKARYNSELHNVPKEYLPPPKIIECKATEIQKKKECSEPQQEVLGSLGKEINCFVDNAAKTIEEIKQETKASGSK